MSLEQRMLSDPDGFYGFLLNSGLVLIVTKVSDQGDRFTCELALPGGAYSLIPPGLRAFKPLCPKLNSDVFKGHISMIFEAE